MILLTLDPMLKYLRRTKDLFLISRGNVKIYKVPTYDNIADPLTIPFVQRKHEVHIRSSDIRGMSDWLYASGRLLVYALDANLVGYIGYMYHDIL